ncbi:flagellum-specific ATP synthase-like [Periplaneta americana]|uniref:flagellum-specific ATP synthase-like n=1 Tax=Periplaneta americana TaxID=6978 RepID=UPI0037E84211
MYVMPYQHVQGISPGCLVKGTQRILHVPVGNSLLGRVVDGLGQPIDQKGPVVGDEFYPVFNTPPDAMTRPRITIPIQTGIRVIDSLFSIGEGQRVGIFAGSGVGKSTLLGMIARNIDADVNVIALIGERGREVREFIEKDLGEEGLKKTILVVATSDTSPLMRIRAAHTATTIAEFFRDQNKKVVLMMDSLTRFARAQREIGLATGEPPTAGAFPPSVFTLLPELLERAGTSQRGSITGFYTVLVEGDDFNEPITDTVRGILDGHIYLDRGLAGKAFYPAIDVTQSISRAFTDIVTPEHIKSAMAFRESYALYKDQEDLINIGAYQRGTNFRIDQVIAKKEEIDSFLRQSIDEKTDFDKTYQMLKTLNIR